MAIAWLANNFGLYREEFMTNNYIKAAKDLVVDDNMGIGYALFVRLFGFGRVLYLAQMITVAVAAWYAVAQSEHLIFDGMISWEPKAWLVAAYVVTNPLILQSICTVLPGALILASILFLIGGVRRNNLKVIFSSGIAMSVLNPDYIYVFSLAMVPVSIYLFVKKKKKGIALIWGAAFIFFVGAFLTERISNPYAYGGVKKDIPYLELQRIVCGSLSDNAELMTTYYHMDMYEDMRLADKVPEQLALTYCRKCELAFGKEKAEEIYDYLIEVTLQKGVGFYMKPIVKDMIYYAFTPYSVCGLYLTGGQDTGIANPLYYFMEKNMLLGKIYLFFGTISSLALLTVSIPKIVHKKANVIYGFYSIFVLTVYGTFIALRGFDYRNTLFIVVAWPLLGLLAEGVVLDGNRDSDIDGEFNIDAFLHGTNNIP